MCGSQRIGTDKVAHYCKKLEKCGLVCIKAQKENTEKLISLARCEHQATLILKKRHASLSLSSLLKESKDSKEPKESKDIKANSKSPKTGTTPPSL